MKKAQSKYNDLASLTMNKWAYVCENDFIIDPLIHQQTSKSSLFSTNFL